MPRRSYRPRLLKGKIGIKHAGTLLANSGSGSVPTKQVIIESSAGARTEAVQELQDNAFTDETCRAGDCIKFVNIHLQVASRFTGEENKGWLEYAVCWKRESESDLTITQLGVLTLGNVATNRYRNDCLWTGFIPVFNDGAHGAELQLKMPKAKQFLKIGEELVLFTFFRSQLSTDTSTDRVRQVLSYNYKAYS